MAMWSDVGIEPVWSALGVYKSTRVTIRTHFLVRVIMC